MSNEVSSDVIRASMEKNGWRKLESITPFEKILKIDPSFRFASYEREGELILISDGCRRSRKIAHDYDEYLVAIPATDQDYFVELANYVVFFHLTLGPLYPARIYSLGDSFVESAPFHDLLVVAPYFLTQTTYPIMDGARRIYLNFCVPILENEKEWALNRQFHGVDGALWEFKAQFFANKERTSFL